MFCDELLVAPVVEANATSRNVTLPSGSWINFWTGETIDGGKTITVSADKSTIPVFIRSSAVIPVRLNSDFKFGSNLNDSEILNSLIITTAKENRNITVYKDEKNSNNYAISKDANGSTVLNAEKGSDIEKKTDDINFKGISFKADQKPEIIPGVDIKPVVDIPLVVKNLNNADFDIQAQQMEEIARVSIDNSANAVPYIVKEVFSSLIDITKKDTSGLQPPSEEQIEARKKVIANVISLETAKDKNNFDFPYKLTEKEIALANQISPMEQAERNKEYALYTMAILAKVYTDEVEKQTGNIVPITDLPGVSATVDALRYNPNAGVKIAAIDSLRHISRPEYKEELNTIFQLAQADSNPQVGMAAARAIATINTPKENK
jgi:hypothetical protein